MNLTEQVADGVGRVRSLRPLIHHVTNYISINDCANVTLAAGASPIMANDPAEVAEVVSQSSALVLNLGTPNTRMLESMLIAGRQANVSGIPVILDPVGIGMTQVRTRVAEQLLQQVRLSVVRGNLAEIQRMAGICSAMKGIDSLADASDAPEIVRQAAAAMGCLVTATGPVDFISDGRQVCRLENGVDLLSRVTGTGCMTTSLTACCFAAMGPSLAAAAGGAMWMGIAGEMAREAMQVTEGTGMFRVRLLDAVSTISRQDILQRGRCTLV